MVSFYCAFTVPLPAFKVGYYLSARFGLHQVFDLQNPKVIQAFMAGFFSDCLHLNRG